MAQYFFHAVAVDEIVEMLFGTLVYYLAYLLRVQPCFAGKISKF